MQVKFYILASADKSTFKDFIISKSQELHKNKNYIHIIANDELCSEIDDDLWLNNNSDFLAHMYIRSTVDEKYQNLPIILSSNIDFSPTNKQVLLNFSSAENTKINGYEEIIEIVYQNETSLMRSRKNYKFYKQSGMKIETSNII